MRNRHENQQKILDYLLDHPDGATLDELSAYIGITKTATKEHVNKLEAAGYLSFKDARGSVGRPRRHYMLSSQGHETFPRQYSWLSSALLELLAKDFGDDLVQKLMTNLADEVARPFEEKFKSAKSSAELLGMVTASLNDLGYRTTLKQSDLRKGAIIEATNCVYHTVAKEHPALCAFDIKFLEKVTGGMDVRLETCITRGDAVCRFCLKKA